MNLSEAMKLGAAMTPKSTCVFFGDDGSTCAMGAACFSVGIGKDDLFLDIRAMHKRFPILDLFVQHPEEPQTRIELSLTVYDLNDNYGWTREKIANWIEMVEVLQSTAAACASTQTKQPAVGVAARGGDVAINDSDRPAVVPISGAAN